ncbi:MAG: hypothetical protein JWP85_2548, partial [Rhodoglobus sp.]|nr:hypothetical protein [Rhodoglobus sp.]
MSAAPNQAGSALALRRSRNSAMTPTEHKITSTVI